jgi:hypothetical protein
VRTQGERVGKKDVINDMRATAPETAYGCTGGGRL